LHGHEFIRPRYPQDNDRMNCDLYRCSALITQSCAGPLASAQQIVPELNPDARGINEIFTRGDGAVAYG